MLIDLPKTVTDKEIEKVSAVFFFLFFFASNLPLFSCDITTCGSNEFIFNASLHVPRRFVDINPGAVQSTTASYYKTG